MLIDPFKYNDLHYLELLDVNMNNLMKNCTTSMNENLTEGFREAYILNILPKTAFVQKENNKTLIATSYLIAYSCKNKWNIMFDVCHDFKLDNNLEKVKQFNNDASRKITPTNLFNIMTRINTISEFYCDIENPISQYEWIKLNIMKSISITADGVVLGKNTAGEISR